MKKIHFDEIDSTNTYLEKNYMNLPDLCAVYAAIQTAGKGRLNRKWESGRGGLWFSVLFKNSEWSPSTLQRVCSMASIQTLIRCSDKDKTPFGLKWPNDIYYKDKKISGCLQKNIFSGSDQICIVGTGINVNNAIGEELRHKGVSLKMINDREYELTDILDKILLKIERELEAFDEADLHERYKNYSIIKPGTKVKVQQFENEGIMVGEVLDYPTDDIRILSDGKVSVFKAGDVTLKEWE